MLLHQLYLYSVLPVDTSPKLMKLKQKHFKIYILIFRYNFIHFHYFVTTALNSLKGDNPKYNFFHKKSKLMKFKKKPVQNIIQLRYQCLKWTVAQSPNATNILFGRPKAAPN